MAGNDGDTRRMIAVGKRNAGVARHGMDRGDACNHFERNARRSQHFRLLAAAAKHERIASFEAHNAFAFAGLGQQQGIQLGLRDTARAVMFAAVDDLRGGRREPQQLTVDEAVINHHVRPAQ